MARQCPVEHRPGLLGRVLSAQAAHPRGVLGHAMGRIWVTETAAANDKALTLLAAAPRERVLEIGFGPGRAILQLAAAGAHVTGIDASPVMLTQARRRNAAAIRAEQVQLLTGHADALPLPDAAVDAVLAVHSVYFWADLAAGLRETHRVLAPGGRVVIAFRAAEHGLPRRFDPAVYRVPTTRGIQQALDAAGFDTSAVERDPQGVTYALAYTSSDSAPAHGS
ncbi:class I SAM-dependent methyltransferase [Pseudonocardia sp. GCM10023141]|uniref:class I SAM-dependent methyltransferase n=1 Tax=Pseudonocardia sp. GCM10023141 TaxID=3252653 RepID=UPI00361CB8FE